MQVDRWPILDATEQQAATVRELAVAAACYCATHGRRGGLSLAGQVLWYVTVPTADLEDVLEALLALERDEHEPARTLVVRYRAPRTPAPPSPVRRRRAGGRAVIRRCAAPDCGYLTRWHAYCPLHRPDLARTEGEAPVTEHVHRTRAARGKGPSGRKARARKAAIGRPALNVQPAPPDHTEERHR